MMSKYVFFLLGTLLFPLLTGCEADPPEGTTTTPRPQPLSLGQLVDLKKTAEAIEGLFMTTALSDTDKAYAKTGKYIYVCVRFLNDPGVNKIINRQGLPLLVQVSDRPESPQGAQAVFVLKPRTKKQLVYRDKKDLKLEESFIQLNKKPYRIWNVEFNPEHRLHRVVLAPRDLPVSKILKAEAGHLQLFTDEEFDIPDEPENDSEDLESSGGGEEGESDPLLQLKTIKHFAPMSSRSCQYWNLSHYTHSSETPSYLQVKYQSTKAPVTPASQSSGEPASPVSTTPLPENKPHTPVPQNN